VKHVFGPVPSRRLGFSLGVDPVVPKTCTLDCVYCELGSTTDLTVERRPYVPVDGILEELGARLAEHPDLDFITLSGSGEPTLNSDIGRLIDGIKAMTDVPVAVLTNGTLLADPAVRSALMRADVVAPSLDAVSEASFQAVNRPHESLDAAAIVDGLITFADEYSGRIWLEVVFVEGLNDDSDEIDRLAAIIERVKPDRVHVNTVVRPPAVPDSRALSAERLSEIAARLGPSAEVIASASGPPQATAVSDASDIAIAMAARRPVTAHDVARSTGTSQASAAKMLNELVEKGVLSVVRHGETLYYRQYSERGCQ
jgi:wyosine [tRNA(Phe)-imidazoG37] synthetase (radical SAM superfamily)